MVRSIQVSFSFLSSFEFYLNTGIPCVISPLYVDLSLKATHLPLGYKLSLSQVFYFCLYPWRLIPWSLFWSDFFLKDSVWVLCHQDRQPVSQEQKCSGPVAGLQFIDWVSVEDIWVLLPLFSVHSGSWTEEINEAQLCKIGVKYVQLWLHIYQRALFDFPLDSIHYQNGLQKLFIKNKLMLINSDCSGH